MSDILVIVPNTWVQVSYDEMAGITGYSFDYFKELSGRSTTDLNDRLVNWLPPDKYIEDVLVINEQLFFKYTLKE